MKTYNELGHVILGTALRALAEQVSQDAEHIYAKFEFAIQPKWFPVFYVLAAKGADSVVNIAKEIQQSHVSVSKIIKEMQAADLINRQKSPSDSRVTLITLNQKAQAMIPAMEQQCQAVDTVITQLTEDSGFDLWQAITATQEQLQQRSLSARINNYCTPSKINIEEYAPKHQLAFKALNVAWISQHWQLEAPDLHALDDPQSYIISKGGCIILAIDRSATDNAQVVGCCALIAMGEHSYELAKMAVSPTVKGQGIGLLLGHSIIERAKNLGAKRLYLESNSALIPAINLYKKLGFKQMSGASSPYQRCDVHMELHLNVYKDS